MRLVLYLYFIYILSPYVFQYSKATSTNQYAGHTYGQQTLHEPNGSITTAWDTPDDGPKKTRNM
jgi:hypothetical protein